jgi:hypothetical protein
MVSDGFVETRTDGVAYLMGLGWDTDAQRLVFTIDRNHLGQRNDSLQSVGALSQRHSAIHKRSMHAYLLFQSKHLGEVCQVVVGDVQLARGLFELAANLFDHHRVRDIERWSACVFGLNDQFQSPIGLELLQDG